MTVDQSTSASAKQPSQLVLPIKYWVQDTGLSTIADLINAQLNQDAGTQPDTSNDDKHLGEEQTPQQDLRLNLIQHCRAASSLKSINLFKGFILALRAADPLLVVLPYAASKQHYTPITSNKQVHSVEGNKMLQFFQPCYKNNSFLLVAISTSSPPFPTKTSSKILRWKNGWTCIATHSSYAQVRQRKWFQLVRLL
jgi:hypothetical protein